MGVLPKAPVGSFLVGEVSLDDEGDFRFCGLDEDDEAESHSGGSYGGVGGILPNVAGVGVFSVTQSGGLYGVDDDAMLSAFVLLLLPVLRSDRFRDAESGGSTGSTDSAENPPEEEEYTEEEGVDADEEEEDDDDSPADFPVTCLAFVFLRFGRRLEGSFLANTPMS